MKILIPVLLLSLGLSCATTKPGPKIELGSCARSQVIYVFLDDQDQPLGMVPTSSGCRCSVKIDDKEYVPSEAGDESKCQKESQTSLSNELDKNL